MDPTNLNGVYMTVEKTENPLQKILAFSNDKEFQSGKPAPKDLYDLDIKLSSADLGDHPVDCTSETCNCLTKNCITHSACATCSCRCPSRFCSR